MTEQHEPKSTMIRYLLGQMSDSERTSFESQYQKDSPLFYELAALENDLIDLYALGALSEAEQKRMRSFMADPDRQKRLAFARTLARHSGPGVENVRPSVPEAPTSWFSWEGSKRLAVRAIAATMIVGISWLFLANRNLRRELEVLRNQQLSAEKKEQALEQQIDALTGELEDRGKSAKSIEQAPLLAQNTVSFSLRSDVVRGDGPAPPLAIPPSTDFVVLDVTVPGQAPSRYDLFLETADGNLVLRQERVRGKSVDGLNTQLAIKLRSHILKDGDYVLRVAATVGQKTEDVAGYGFRVVHR